MKKFNFFSILTIILSLTQLGFGMSCDGFWDCTTLSIIIYFVFFYWVGIILFVLGIIGVILFKQGIRKKIAISILKFGFIWSFLWGLHYIRSSMISRQFYEEQIRNIQQLPFKVYGINDLPGNAEIERVGIDGSYRDLEGIIVTTHIRYGCDWTEIYQMKMKSSFGFPEKCPDSYFSVNVSNSGIFTRECQLSSSFNGNNLYQSVDRYGVRENLISFQYDQTFVIMEYFRENIREDISEDELNRIQSIVSSFYEYSPKELAEFQKKYFNKIRDRGDCP